MSSSRFVPLIAAAALIPGACGRSNDSFEVMDFGWVDTSEPVELEFIGPDQTAYRCAVNDGATIRIDTDNMQATVVDGNNEDGTTGLACPDGTKFTISEDGIARIQDAASALDALKSEAREAKSLDRDTNEENQISLSGWFDTVNNPERQYNSPRGGTYGAEMAFGEPCVLDTSRTVYILGQLSSGNFAAVVEGGEVVGTPCPDGALIVVPESIVAEL